VILSAFFLLSDSKKYSHTTGSFLLLSICWGIFILDGRSCRHCADHDIGSAHRCPAKIKMDQGDREGAKLMKDRAVDHKSEWGQY